MSDADILKDRQRIIDLLRAHKDWKIEDVLIRLENLINSGVDLTEEMKKPIEDRPLGFHWPDEQ